MQNLVLWMMGGGTVIAAMLSGFMAYRAAFLQQRGKALPAISVK